MPQTSLPIWQIHDAITGALNTGNRLVLVAPTGSGKTTQVPQMLLDAGLAGENKIVVLQPRRVAARTVAARVAWERNCRLGAEVGYQIRFDDQTSLGTRICFVTEGILLRWLQDDRTLPEVGVVLFDEFHERNLLSDVALALVKRLQQSQRPDLKMVVMSATLEAEPVADYLGGCPVLISEGQSFPVELHYLDYHDERPAPEQAADTVERIVNSNDPGDILVFMPGMGEINSTINALRAARTHERLAFIPLHGELPPEDQDRTFAPNPLRKVVVATNVAETSVTIDGIRHVVDGGLARVARYDAERGINTLFLEEISRASAEQRKGRAGRTAPGTCYRLWTESGQLNRPERNTPEIQRADLAEVVLLLHSFHIRRAAEFDWLDKPDPAAIDRAEKLLRLLGALSSSDLPASGSELSEGTVTVEPTRTSEPGTRNSDLTAIGRQMLRLPMHPRYSRMLVEAAQHDCVPAAALCASLISGRDLLMRLGCEEKHIAEARELFEASQDSDFYTLMRAYQFAKRSNFSVETCRRYGIHAQTARQVEQTYEQIMRLAEKQNLFSKGAELRFEQTVPPHPGPLPQGEGTATADGERPPVPSPNAVNRATTLPLPEGEGRGEGEGHAGILDEPGVVEAHASRRFSRGDPPSDDALLRCIMAGFIDQLCLRRDQGTLECELTEGRTGTLMRESVVQNAPLFVAASIREVASRGSQNLTLLGLASTVKREWVEEMFPQHLTVQVEHLFDRTHKRVAAVKLVRFRDLVIHHEHQREVDESASGQCLAEAYRKSCFELPLFNHEVKQFIARVSLVCAARPELEFPAFDEAAIKACLARAFKGLTLAKEAQATPLRDHFFQRLAPEQLGWLDELAPLAIPWLGEKKLKLLYPEEARDEDGETHSPEAQVKLQDCFQLKAHPHICEGKVPVKLWLCAPDGKRIEATLNWPAFKANSYPKLKPALQRKYPGTAWL